MVNTVKTKLVYKGYTKACSKLLILNPFHPAYLKKYNILKKYYFTIRHAKESDCSSQEHYNIYHNFRDHSAVLN